MGGGVEKVELELSENKHSLECTTQKKKIKSNCNCTCVAVGNWCSNETFDWKCDDRTTKKNIHFPVIVKSAYKSLRSRLLKTLVRILFPIVLLIMLYKAQYANSNILICFLVRSSNGTIQMKVTKQFFTLVLSYNNCYYYAVQDGSKFNICGWNPKCAIIQRQATEQCFFLWCCSLCCVKQMLLLTFFKLMDEMAKPRCSIQIKTSEKHFLLVGFSLGSWEKGKIIEFESPDRISKNGLKFEVKTTRTTMLKNNVKFNSFFNKTMSAYCNFFAWCK